MLTSRDVSSVDRSRSLSSSADARKLCTALKSVNKKTGNITSSHVQLLLKKIIPILNLYRRRTPREDL